MLSTLGNLFGDDDIYAYPEGLMLKENHIYRHTFTAFYIGDEIWLWHCLSLLLCEKQIIGQILA